MSIGLEWLKAGMAAKQRREGQEQFGGLLGQKQTPYQMDESEMFPGEQPIQGLQNKGTGLLGGEINPMEFYAKTASIPGYEQFGMSGLLGLQKAQIDAQSKTQFGGFKDLNEFLKAKDNIRNRANTQLAPHRESLRKYNQATNIINQRGGFDKLGGADDTLLIKAFASMMLPGEAVMEGDIGAIINQDGIPGWLKSFVQKVQGEGQLAPPERAKIYRTMTDLAEQANKEYGDVRGLFDVDIQQGGFNPKAIFTPRIPYNPYAIPQNLLSQEPPAPLITTPPGTVPYKG